MKTLLRTTLSCVVGLLAISAVGQSLKFDVATHDLGPYGCTPGATCRDANGNAYITGSCEARPLTEEVTKEGVVVWRNYYVKPKVTQGAFPGFIFHDQSTGNTVVVGELQDMFVAGQNGIYLEGISSGGSTLWQVDDYTHSGISGAVQDPNGGVILALNHYSGSVQVFDLVKYGSGGSLVFKVPQSIGTAGTACLALAGDASGNLYSLVSAGAVGYAVRYNEGSGAAMWKSAVGPYSAYPKLTPLAITALPNGDAVVTGAASNSNSSQPLYVSLDRLSSTDGAFVSRKGVLVGDSTWHVSNYQLNISQPVTDSVGNIYVLNELLDSGFYEIWCATKVSSALSLVWATYIDGTLDPPSIAPLNGGALIGLPSGVPGHRQELWSISSNGSVSYKESSSHFGVPAAFSIFADDPSLVSGTVFGNGDSGYGYGFQTFDGVSGSTLVSSTDDPTGNISNNLISPVTDTEGNVYAIDSRVGPSLSRIDKFNAQGALQWTVNIHSGSGSWIGNPTLLRWCANGTLIVAANVPQPAYFHRTLGLAAVSTSSGATLWTREWNDNGAFYFAPEYLSVNADGSFLIEAFNDSEDHFVGKFSSSGNMLWDRFVASSLFSPSISSNPAGDVCICYSASQGSNTGFKLIQYNSSGSAISSFFAFSNSQDSSPKAVIDGPGNAYVTYSTPFGRALSRVSAAGKLLGTTLISAVREFNGILNFDFRNDVIDVAVGSGSPSTLTISKVSTSGKVLWSTSYRAGTGDSPTTLAPDPKGDIIVLGTSPVTASDPFVTTAFVHKVSSANGAVVYHYTYSGKFSCPDVPISGMAIEPDGTPVLTGQSRLSGTEAVYVAIAFRLAS